MSIDLATCSEKVARLDNALTRLRPVSDALGAAPPDGREWYQLLEHKLVPQLSEESHLVMAIVGGTNIGKSVIFNHLAGENASGVSPLAAGTRHPVCLVPDVRADEAALGRLFEGFSLRAWSSAEEAMDDCPEHLLLWRAGARVPPRLLLLDTPDIDSDAQVNWQRAEHIRQAADVLVAVLTQQKYNDAAVKQFFRKAAEADKPVVVVFNQCDLDEDREFWPQWLETFVGETGAEAALVYVVPYDRAAAGRLQLPFYDVGRQGRQPPGQPAALRDELAALRFDEIKLRTLRGALATVLDPARGAPAYLAELRDASGEFAEAAAALGAGEMARVQWPALPAAALVEEIRQWWDTQRSGWSRGVHRFYRALGTGLTWPLKKAWTAVSGPGGDPLEGFRRQERAAIVMAVEHMLRELDRLATVGNETLRPRLRRLLAGAARAELLAKVEAAHAELPAVDDDYREFLRSELTAWTEQNPRALALLRSLDQLAAVARPAITVTLVVSGWIVAGGLVHEAAGQAAVHTAAELTTEAAITGGITGGGEVLVSGTSQGIKHAAATVFRRLQARYAEQRAGWLAGWLERELLGGLLADLRQGAQAPKSEPFQQVEQALADLSAAAEGHFQGAAS